MLLVGVVLLAVIAAIGIFTVNRVTHSFTTGGGLVTRGGDPAIREETVEAGRMGSDR